MLLAFLSNPHGKNQQTCVTLPSKQIPNLAASHSWPTSFLIQAFTFYHQIMVIAANEPPAPTPKSTLTPTARGTPLLMSQTQRLLHSKQDLPFPLLCVLHSPPHSTTAPLTGRASSYPRAFALATYTAWNVCPLDGHMALPLICFRALLKCHQQMFLVS